MIWKTHITPEELNARCRNTLVERLGIEFTEVGANHMSAQMPVDERTRQPAGIVIRLWEEAATSSLPAHDLPEIL